MTKSLILNKGRVTFHTSAAIGQLRQAHYMLKQLAENSPDTDYTLLLEEYEATISIMQSLDITGRKIMEIKQQYELKSARRRKPKAKVPSGQFAMSI